MTFVLCALGIAGVASAIYFLFKKIMYILYILLVFVGATIAVDDITSGEHWALVIISYGIVIGLIAIPALMFDEMNQMKTKIKDLESKVNPES